MEVCKERQPRPVRGRPWRDGGSALQTPDPVLPMEVTARTLLFPSTPPIPTSPASITSKRYQTLHYPLLAKAAAPYPRLHNPPPITPSLSNTLPDLYCITFPSSSSCSCSSCSTYNKQCATRLLHLYYMTFTRIPSFSSSYC